MVVPRSPAMISSATPCGTSTSENRSAISIEPMSRPLIRVSPVIAPTRSCGRTPARRPSPMKTWVVPAGTRSRAAPALAPAAGLRTSLARAPDRNLRDLLLVVRARRRRLVRQLHRRQRHLDQVELVGQRLHDHPVRVEVVLQQALPQRGLGQLQPPGPHVRHRGDLVDGDPLAGDPLDGLEHPVLTRLGERDRHTLPPGPAHPADPVHVRLRRRRDVVVDHVGELLDVQPSGGHVGGDQQVRRAGAQPAHHPVPLLLAHPAVQRLGPVAPAVHRLGEPVDLLTAAAEHDRRGGRLHVQHPAQRGRLVPPGHDVRALPHPGRLPGDRPLPLDLDTDRIGQVLPGQPVDAGRHGGREQHRLPAGRRVLQDRLDVLGEAHVEHLVRLVQHHRAQRAQPQRAPGDVVQRPARRRHHHVHPVVERAQLPADRLPAVDRQHPGAQVLAVAVERLGDLHGQLPGGHQHQRHRVAVRAAPPASAATAAARTRRSCPYRSPPGPADPARPAAGGSPPAGSAWVPRSRARPARPATRCAARDPRRRCVLGVGGNGGVGRGRCGAHPTSFSSPPRRRSRRPGQTFAAPRCVPSPPGDPARPRAPAGSPGQDGQQRGEAHPDVEHRAPQRVTARHHSAGAVVPGVPGRRGRTSPRPTSTPATSADATVATTARPPHTAAPASCAASARRSPHCRRHVPISR